jgi:PEP-CTERM motif
MKMQKIIAIILAVVGILSTGAAETRADSFVIKQGFYENSFNHQAATFSGDNFAVDYFLGGGNFSVETGTLVALFGQWTPPPAIPPVFGFGSGFGTIHVSDVSCDVGAPECGGFLTFTHSPIVVPPHEVFSGEAPFTMTGTLVLGQLGNPNMIVDIAGSGIVHVTVDPFVENGSLARYEFASVPEPSTVALVMSGLVAAGWSRWRGGKRSVSRG